MGRLTCHNSEADDRQVEQWHTALHIFFRHVYTFWYRYFLSNLITDWNLAIYNVKVKNDGSKFFLKECWLLKICFPEVDSNEAQNSGHNQQSWKKEEQFSYHK